MTFIDETKPLDRLLLEDDYDDLEFHPPRSGRAGSWQRKNQNFRFNEAFGPEPVMDKIRESWDRGALLEEGGHALFQTGAGVGKEDVNGQIDMAKAETLLEQAGVLDLKGYKGPTGLFSDDKGNAIKDFQAGNNLHVDGRILPNGETMRTLKTQLTPVMTARIKVAQRKAKKQEQAKVEPIAAAKPDRVQIADNSEHSSVMNDAQPGGLLGRAATDSNAEEQSTAESSENNPSPITLARHYTLPAPLGILNSPTDKDPSKHDLDQTEKRMRGRVAEFRKRGWHRAANQLEQFLDGSGKEVNLSREEMREFEMFRNAEAGNREHFETKAFLAKTKNE